MSNNTDIADTNNQVFLRFDENSGTCGKVFSGFLDGLFTKIQDCFFYLNVLQFSLVLLMYINVGRGKYWKVLLIASIAGFFGAVVENSTVAFICRESVKEKDYKWVVPFLLAEFGWITTEYSIPFLNLTKLKTFSQEIFAKVVYYSVLYVLFPVFIFFRFYIGFFRMKYGVLTSKESKYGHAGAFLIMAASDLLCTIAILYYVRKHNNQEAITHYIKHSSYTILICVDAVSILLGITNALTEYVESLPGSYINPFHCIKSSVILILACDALLFKYTHNASSTFQESSDENEDNYATNYSTTNCNRTNNYMMETSNIHINGSAMY